MRIAAVMLALQSSFATSPLLAWLSEAPGAQTTHIELRASSVGNGIGAYLPQSVQAGEVLFAIPSSSFFSLGTALSHHQLGSAMHRLWESSQSSPTLLNVGSIQLIPGHMGFMVNPNCAWLPWPWSQSESLPPFLVL